MSSHRSDSTAQLSNPQYLIQQYYTPTTTTTAIMTGTTHMKHQHSVAKPEVDGSEMHLVRRRISKACNYCRQRKIKCDGSSPCTNCHSHQIDCVYTKTITKKKRAQPAKKLTLHDLEKRVNKMQSQMDTMNSTLSAILKVLNDRKLSDMNAAHAVPHEQLQQHQQQQLHHQQSASCSQPMGFEMEDFSTSGEDEEVIYSPLSDQTSSLNCEDQVLSPAGEPFHNTTNAGFTTFAQSGLQHVPSNPFGTNQYSGAFEPLDMSIVAKMGLNFDNLAQRQDEQLNMLI